MELLLGPSSRNRITKKSQLIPEDKSLPGVLAGWEEGNPLPEYLQAAEEAPQGVQLPAEDVFPAVWVKVVQGDEVEGSQEYALNI